MTEGLNRVLLLGNLGADPELKMTQGGTAVLKIRMATSESYLDRNQSRQERTEWHSVTVWGKRADALAKILTKGDRICVEGSLRTSSYEKDGSKRYRTEVNANKIILSGRHLGAKTDDPPNAATDDAQAPPAPSGAAGVDQTDFSTDYPDDIPFLIDAQTRGWSRP